MSSAFLAPPCVHWSRPPCALTLASMCDACSHSSSHWSRNIPSNAESADVLLAKLFFSLAQSVIMTMQELYNNHIASSATFLIVLRIPFPMPGAGASRRKEEGIKWPLLCTMMLPCCLAKAVQRPTLFGVFWLSPSWGIFHRSPIRWSAWLVQGLGFYTPRLREPSHNPRSTVIIRHRQFPSTPGCIRFSDLPLRCTVHSPVQCSSMGSPEEGILQRDRVQSDPGGRFLYFAFGSNLFADRIHINCPSAERVGPAKLFGRVFFLRWVLVVDSMVDWICCQIWAW